MQAKGRKKAAGGWLLREIEGRVTGTTAVVAFAVGVGAGLAVRGVPAVANAMPAYSSWWSVVGFLVVMGLGVGVWALSLHRVQSTWGRGIEAERHVGDRIEHALVRPGCAFAHDVKEALGGAGNVDHVVLTPAGVWVVETKASWLGKRAFRDALRQTAQNVERVRRRLPGPDVRVRGALVIANRREHYEREHDWAGEPVTSFGVVSFWRRLQRECLEHGQGIDVEAREGLAREVWNLGSILHLDD